MLLFKYYLNTICNSICRHLYQLFKTVFLFSFLFLSLVSLLYVATLSLLFGGQLDKNGVELCSRVKVIEIDSDGVMDLVDFINCE